MRYGQVQTHSGIIWGRFELHFIVPGTYRTWGLQHKTLRCALRLRMVAVAADIALFIALVLVATDPSSLAT